MKYYRLNAPELIKSPSNAVFNIPRGSLWTEKEMRPEWPLSAFVERYLPQRGTLRDGKYRFEKLTPFVTQARSPFRYAIVQLTYQGAVVFTGGGNGNPYDQGMRVRKWAELNNVRYDGTIIHCKQVNKNGEGTLQTITQSIKNGLIIKERIEK